MQEIDKISGLPKDLFDISNIEKEQQKIRIEVKKARFNKVVTVITGIEDKATLKELGKAMKQKFACGGTAKDGMIELQGNHKDRAKEVLVEKGYKKELIDA
jgi:translation initiation factor 1